MSSLENYVDERAREAGFMIAFTHLTIREAAKKMGVSKSTVHKDVTKNLGEIDRDLYQAVRNQLDYHLRVRASRGGRALKGKLKKHK